MTRKRLRDSTAGFGRISTAAAMAIVAAACTAKVGKVQSPGAGSGSETRAPAESTNGSSAGAPASEGSTHRTANDVVTPDAAIDSAANSAAAAPATEPILTVTLGSSTNDTPAASGTNPAAQPASSGVTPTAPELPVVPDLVAPTAQPGVQQPAAQPEATTSAQARKGGLLLPITPFSNMASGYQATNPGFRAILKDGSGKLIAAGPVSMESVINGYTDDASSGSAYGRLVLDIDLLYVDGAVESGALSGRQKGRISICMAQDTQAAYDASACKSLGGNIHPERPFQWIDKSCSYEVADGKIKIVSFGGDTGEGGTQSQLALAVYHPAYGFAAPGKAFKDYQSPLVLDLNANGALDLTDVWADRGGVRFDLEGDGKATLTGWVQSADGLLAIDLDGDGAISSGRELFGEYTRFAPQPAKTSDGRGERTFENGFAALATLDGNRDGRIDDRDPAFGRILVWRDLDQDGTSRPAELMPLAKANIVSISLAYERTGSVKGPRTVMENEVRLAATFRTKDGREHQIADVWFKQRRGADVASGR